MLVRVILSAAPDCPALSDAFAWRSTWTVGAGGGGFVGGAVEGGDVTGGVTGGVTDDGGFGVVAVDEVGGVGVVAGGREGRFGTVGVVATGSE